MKRYVFILGFFTFCASGFAYTRITVATGETPKWASMPVSYWINEKGFSKITNGSDFLAVQSSFQTWESVASADVRFVYAGTTTAAGVGRDGMNVVSFTDTSAPMGSSTIAATFSFFKRDTNGLTIDEADIAFNPVLDFSTSAEQNKFDIQSVLTHEIGQ